MKNYLVITGASRGIGKATASLFIEQGWSVINLSRNACDLPLVINIHADLSVSNWFEPIIPVLHDALDSPTKIAVVHNAAVNQKNSVAEVTQADFCSALAVNLAAPIALNQCLLAKMLPGSSIIYLGSTLSEKAVKNAVSYVVSKHAVVGLMRSTCQDLAGRGIHTACVCPGFTDTEMLRQHLGNDETLLQSIHGRMASKRLIAPQEIAELIWFCANHEVINGSVLPAYLGQIEQ